MKWRVLGGAAVAALLAISIACGSSPTSPSGSGSFSVYLKDTPFSDAGAVLVTFSEVSVHASGGGWTTIPFANNATSRTCDLKQLQTAQDVLGTTTLAPGHYTEARITVTNVSLYSGASSGGPCNSTVTASGLIASVNVPSGQFILNRPFDVTANTTMKMLLDFDGNSSITKLGNGNYQISPVITVVSVS